MKSINDFPDWLQEILRQLCADVGANADNFDFGAPNWYHAHTWTQSEQDNFVDRLTLQLQKRKAFRQAALGTFFTQRKEDCRAFAEGFVWQHGWKIREEARKHL